MGMDIYGNNGNYFRANIWQWRAIIYAMELVEFDVPVEWCFNDGAGLSDQQECNGLANKLAEFLKLWDGSLLTVKTNNFAVCKETGRFVEPGTPDAKSPFSVERDHLQEFVDFLRECDGFEIC